MLQILNIYIGGRHNSFLKNEIKIIGYDNSILLYNYQQHGFDASDTAKEQLALAISKKYGGKYIKRLKDISKDTQPSWVIDYFEVVANDGIQEMTEKENIKKNIKKC